MNNVFITGATGFLGSNLLKEILLEKKNNAYILIRAKDGKSALRRKNALIDQMFSRPRRRKVSSRLHMIQGDITKHNLGLHKKTLDMLRKTVNTIYHCAAIREFTSSDNAIKKVNVKGTQNVLKVALDWKKNGHLENVNHISTAYIAGKHKGTFFEKHVSVSQNFNNPYERTKFEAEKAVLRYRKKGLPVSIYRPSIIADSPLAKTNATSGLLQLLAVFTLEIFEKIPANSNTKLNMIPIHSASKAIYLISRTKKRPLNQTYHIVNPNPVRLADMLNTASTFFKFKKPKCIPIAKFCIHDLSPVQQKILGPFIPYLNQKLSFDMRNTTSLLKRYNFRIPRISKKRLVGTFRYYQSSGLIPKKERLCH